MLSALLILPLLTSPQAEILEQGCYVAITHQDDASETELLGVELIKAKTTKQRDEVFDQLVALAEMDAEAEDVLSNALTTRWTSAWAQVTNRSFLRKVDKLASKREKLDKVRKAALDLIFDETRYFYPYTQPQVSAKQAAQYHAVQREVFSLVKDVTKVWESSPKVKLSKGIQAALVEIQWLRGHKEHAAAGLALPPGQPAWLEFLPANMGTLTFQNFPLDAIEAQRMGRDAKVQAYNERLWAVKTKHKKTKRKDKTDPKKAYSQIASSPEQEQVRVTNRYRLMMGRPAVTWDPILQAATHMHSEYMAKTGEFGHYEKDPARKTPFDRMRLLGYDRGASENCSNGRAAPKDAHKGWMGSSGHHRNLLMATHKQMASGSNGPYWTQNFGVDQDAEGELE